jgi:hypothetical protein
MEPSMMALMKLRLSSARRAELNHRFSNCCIYEISRPKRLCQYDAVLRRRRPTDFCAAALFSFQGANESAATLSGVQPTAWGALSPLNATDCLIGIAGQGTTAIISPGYGAVKETRKAFFRPDLRPAPIHRTGPTVVWLHFPINSPRG